jgi:hypothetical protein
MAPPAETPPPPVETPPAETPPPPDPAYTRLALHRTDEFSWVVADGSGHVLTLAEWAARTGDRTPYERALRARVRRLQTGERGLGIGLLGLGAATALLTHPLDDGAGSRAWRDRLTEQDALTVAGAVLAAAGFGVVVVSFGPPPPAGALDASVRDWVDRGHADGVIAAYNSQLRADTTAPRQ